MNSGRIKAGPLTMVYKGITYEVELCESGVFSYEGKIFRTPSAMSNFIINSTRLPGSQRGSNGWACLRYNGVTLSKLRQPGFKAVRKKAEAPAPAPAAAAAAPAAPPRARFRFLPPKRKPSSKPELSPNSKPNSKTSAKPRSRPSPKPKPKPRHPPKDSTTTSNRNDAITSSTKKQLQLDGASNVKFSLKKTNPLLAIVRGLIQRRILIPGTDVLSITGNDGHLHRATLLPTGRIEYAGKVLMTPCELCQEILGTSVTKFGSLGSLDRVRYGGQTLASLRNPILAAKSLSAVTSLLEGLLCEDSASGVCTLSMLIRAGIMFPGNDVLSTVSRGKVHRATLLEDGSIQFGGKRLKPPSGPRHTQQLSLAAAWNKVFYDAQPLAHWRRAWHMQAMQTLLHMGILAPGKDVLSLHHAAITNRATLLSDGRIQNGRNVFDSPFAFACQLTGSSDPDSGWRCTKYRGRSLDYWRMQLPYWVGYSAAVSDTAFEDERQSTLAIAGVQMANADLLASAPSANASAAGQGATARRAGAPTAAQLSLDVGTLQKEVAQLRKANVALRARNQKLSDQVKQLTKSPPQKSGAESAAPGQRAQSWRQETAIPRSKSHDEVLVGTRKRKADLSLGNSRRGPGKRPRQSPRDMNNPLT